MLEVYDRVLPSRSTATLLGLVVLVGFLFAASACSMRSAPASLRPDRLGARRETERPRLQAGEPGALAGRATKETSRPLRDLDRIRSSCPAAARSAMFDLPWMPLYLGDLLRLPSADRA